MTSKILEICEPTLIIPAFVTQIVLFFTLHFLQTMFHRHTRDICFPDAKALGGRGRRRLAHISAETGDGKHKLAPHGKTFESVN